MLRLLFHSDIRPHRREEASGMTTSKRSATPAKTSAITPQDILAGLTPDVAGIVQKLRKLIAETVPDAAQVAYPVWKGIGYHHGTSGYFCAIFPQATGVKLGFEFGVLLPDPDGVLEGAGKQVRYSSDLKTR